MDDRERTFGPDEEEAPSRPRVVDKRISARPAAEPAPQPAAPPEPAPAPPEPEPQAATPPESPTGEEPPIWTPEQEEQARRIAEEIVATPSAEWLVRSAVTFANVAATKLELGDPADAQLCIDALAALLDRFGTEMGEATPPLRQHLAQLQMAFASRVAPPPPAGT